MLACSSASTHEEPLAADVTAERCVVRLHGKGDDGAPTALVGGVAEVAPRGNEPGWDGRQWLYFPDERFDEARSLVEAAIAAAGCRQVVLNGFSNGGAFAAKLYCRGETFGGRLVGVVVDDPVPDAGTVGCEPDDQVLLALYWSTAQDAISHPGYDCSAIDGTCEGGRTVGIDAYAAALDADILRSVHDEHRWYRDAPELRAWLDAASAPAGSP